ncbi:MAG: hypothetical protein ABDH66_07090 [Bacteroidia bacterium]
MRIGLLFFLFGLAGWAQSGESDPRTAIYYDEARQSLIIVADQPYSGEKLEILDLIGRRIRTMPIPQSWSSEAVAISVADLPEGLYYVRWLTENGRIRAVRRFSIDR